MIPMQLRTPPLLVDVGFDAALFRGSRQIDSFWSKSEDPFVRGFKVRDAIDASQDGDYILLGHGLIKFKREDGNVKMPSVTFNGMGKYDTLLWGDIWSDDQGTQFALKNTNLYNLGLQCDTYKHEEDGRTVGFDDSSSGYHVKVKNCQFIGNAWCFWDWNNLAEIVTIEDTDFIFGRIGLANEGSGDNPSQFTLRRCIFYGDAELSHDIGATSNMYYGGVFGAVLRGGDNRFFDCEMYLKGRPLTEENAEFSWTTRVCGITDTFAAEPSPATKIELHRHLIQITSNGADINKCFYLDLKDPKVAANCVKDGVWGTGLTTTAWGK